MTTMFNHAHMINCTIQIQVARYKTVRYRFIRELSQSYFFISKLDTII